MTGQEEALERLKAQLARETEAYKADLAIRGEDRKAVAASHLTLMGAAFTYAGIAIRGIFVANGGGVVAILTFTGNLWARSDPAAASVASGVAASTRFFVYGMAAALATSFAAYLSQYFFARDAPKRKSAGGSVFQAVAIFAALASLGCFGWGAISAAGALQAGQRASAQINTAGNKAASQVPTETH